ncbi:hypothetical protein ABMA27_015691 [Loxostege sticticalis]|uniref:Reverse transcriptase domain-containing protein n=1 Tax=Loxostege sticticalis TaxID=481309 RepID=A0ABR3I3Z1_LOXSC
MRPTLAHLPIHSPMGSNPQTSQQQQQQHQFIENIIPNIPSSNVPPQFFMQMMHMMQQMSERLTSSLEAKVRINDIYLPSFDPDTNVGVREWCQHINKAVETYKLNDFDIRMKVGSLLKGRAKMWVDDWMVTTASWEELRNNLITTFEPENRYSRDILRFREHAYDSSKDISEFLSRAWVLWRRVTKDKLDNTDAVEAVIGCVNDEHCDLTDDNEIAQLRLLLNKYEHLFIRGYPKTRVNTGELEIRLKNPDKYVERRPYRLSPVEREKVRCIISELLEHGIIRESKSPYSSPIILVKKKNGDDRLCVDFRELNANTLRDHYPLPLISDQIDQLADGQFFTTFDMAAGFHQIPIAESSIEKTAFVTPDDLYEYLTMPFGLSNACSVYQRCINRALLPLLGTVAQVYVDDVLSKLMIKNYETEQWQTTLEELQLAMNCTAHRVTGIAPLTLLTQRKHCVPPGLLRLVNIDDETVDIEGHTRHVQQKMSEVAEQDRLRFNQRKAKIRPFQRGDYVLIKNNPRNQTSLDLKFSKPFEICRILENDRYLVKRVVGRGRPRKVAHDQLRRAPQPGDQVTVSAQEDEPPTHDDTAGSSNLPVPSTSRAGLPSEESPQHETETAPAHDDLPADFLLVVAQPSSDEES